MSNFCRTISLILSHARAIVQLIYLRSGTPHIDAADPKPAANR